MADLLRGSLVNENKMLLIDDASCIIFGGELQLGSLSLRHLLPQMVGG